MCSPTRTSFWTACVAEALGPGHSLTNLAGIGLDQPLADRLTEAADALHAHLDRIGALMGALHSGGPPVTRPLTRPVPAEGRIPDRAAAMAETRDTLAELFASERDALRLSPGHSAQLFLGLLFTSSRGNGPFTADLVDVFLNGVLA